jgi:hypothetical protein
MLTHGNDSISKVTDTMSDLEANEKISMIDEKMQLFIAMYQNNKPV